MYLFYKIKEFILNNKINLIIGGVLLFLIVISNCSIYYICKNNNKREVIIENNVPVVQSKEEEVQENKVYKIDIKGEVNVPGVYELHEGSRVIDAINIAGGLKENADTSVNNLSKYITDEMVIVIYSKDEVSRFKEVLKEEKTEEKQCIIYNEIINNDSCKDNIINDSNNTESENLSNSEVDIKISLNTAPLDLLVTIPGVGESKAKSIIEYRETKGQFKTIEEVMNVSGIGEALFEKIKDYITI